METHTDRQMLLWNTWVREDMDVPGKGEFYLMQVAAEVRVLREQVGHMFGGKGREVKLMDFKLGFGEPLTYIPKSAKVAATIAKNVWAAGLGVTLVEKRVPKAEGIRIMNETAGEYQEFLEKTEEFRGN